MGVGPDGPAPTPPFYACQREAIMACIDPDGTLTVTATFLLKALNKRPLPPQEIAKAIGEPVFRVRGNLRELADAGLIQEKDGDYLLTDAGRERL